MKGFLTFTLCLLYLIIVILQTTAKRPPQNPRPRKILKALNRKKVIQDEYIVKLIIGLSESEAQEHLKRTAHLYEVINSSDIGHALKTRKRNLCTSERGPPKYFMKNGLRETVYSVYCMSDDDLSILDEDPDVMTLEEDEVIQLEPYIRDYKDIAAVEDTYVKSRKFVRTRNLRTRSSPVRHIYGTRRRVHMRRNRAGLKTRIGMTGGGLKGSFSQLLPSLGNTNDSCYYEYIDSFGQWGLDRSDAETTDFDSMFSIAGSGNGTDCYIVDTGILGSHVAFRDAITNISRVIEGYNSVGYPETDTTDFDGHGTHVAGLVAGHDYGVATETTIIPVKVIEVDPQTKEAVGTKTSLIQGLEWIRKTVIRRNKELGPRRSVVNLSIGGEKSASVEDAVQSLVDEGITVVVAAGNNNTNACNESPPDVADVITVGCTTIEVGENGKPIDKMCSFSNYGPCVDIMAPGSAIQSSTIPRGKSNSVTETETLSGTSMSAPFVAGAICAFMSTCETPPTPAVVYAWLMGEASVSDIVKMDEHQMTTINRILSIPNCS